jgi:hypothetical protein
MAVLTMADQTKLAQLKDNISTLVAEYIAEINEDAIATEWILVAGATKIDWSDGRQIVLSIHPNVPYTARLGLLTSAQHDTVTVADNDD